MQSIGNVFIMLDSVDSTNNYAMAQLHAGLANHGDTYFTSNQTQGKGQRGRTWVAEPGMNLAISVILVPGMLLISEQFIINAVIALSSIDLVKESTKLSPVIKWPNDIYLNDRKAGGILIENVIRGNEWQFAVAGFGLNVNQTTFPETLINPISLKQAGGNTFDVTEVAKNFCQCVQNRLDRLKALGNDDTMNEYNALLYKRGEIVKLRYKNMVFETMIKAVTKKGCLVTKHAIEQEFNWGEVEWIR